MIPPRTQCPKCQAPTLLLWCRSFEAYCDKCFNARGSRRNPAWDFELLFLPEQTVVGFWKRSPDIQFGQLRQFIEDCLRPRATSIFDQLRTDAPGTIAKLIETLETLVADPQAAIKDPELSSALAEWRHKREALVQRIHDAQNALGKMKKAKRRNYKHVLQSLISRKAFVDSQIKAVHDKMHSMFAIQRHAVNRLRGDFEAWRNGTLGFDSTIPVHHVYWELLKPSGDSWAELMQYFDCLERTKGEIYDKQRLKFIHDFQPDRLYVGRESFEGYVVFIFGFSNVALLECPKLGNALYVMNINNWKELSQLSKTELLTNHRKEVQRLIHSGDGWRHSIKRLLGIRRLI